MEQACKHGLFLERGLERMSSGLYAVRCYGKRKSMGRNVQSMVRMSASVPLAGSAGRLAVVVSRTAREPIDLSSFSRGVGIAQLPYFYDATILTA
jgi:hypothetical protein